MTDTVTLELIHLAPDQLIQHPDNVRRRLGDLAELTKSIKGVGILEPLIVGPFDPDHGGHLVYAGNRRAAAAAKAGLDVVPCIQRVMSDLEVLEVMLVENMQRADITPGEEAKAYARLVELDATVASIAKAVGRSQPHVKGRLALTVLPDKVLDLVDDGILNLGDAAALVDFAAVDGAMDLLVTDTSWHQYARPVDWLKRELVVARKAELLAAEAAKLEAKAIDRYEPTQYFYEDSTTLAGTSSPAPVKALGLTTPDARKHQTEPCHAVHLKTEGGYLDVEGVKVKRTTVCMKPKRHTPGGGSDLQIPGWGEPTRPAHAGGPGDDGEDLPPAADVDPEIAEHRARAQAWRDADEKRIEFWTAWTQRTVLTTDPVLAAYLESETLQLDEIGGVARLWGLDDDQIDQVWQSDDQIGSLAAASTGPTADGRGHVTTAAITHAPVIKLQVQSWDGREAINLRARLLERLIADGYEATDIEIEWLEEANKPPVPDVDAMGLSDELVALLQLLGATKRADEHQDLDPLIEHSSDREDLVERKLGEHRAHPAYDGSTFFTLTELGVQVAEILSDRQAEGS
jgi:ParB/RepB/Spo0J family partition protein